MRIKILVLLISFSAFTLFAQIERETRAVWLATNHRLDWPPPTYNSEKQKKALVEILDDLKRKNFNTVYFQVRSNGTVFFNSSFEPFSQYLTGTIGKDPVYDPLEFAIQEAHKRGIELHAWINVCLVNNGNDRTILQNKNHIIQAKPEWIVEDNRDGQKTLWIDPGLPEARNYTVDLILEMVENYDLDGVHLDYIRYPGKNFDDDFSYKIHGTGLNRDEFRRKNITAIVEDVFHQAKAIKPFIKIGAAPIGVYKRLSGMRSWESYFDLYQDSYGWMKKGIVDYLTPQIYWSINENPSFDLLAKDWKTNEAKSNVILGIGAYREKVKPEIEEMIQLAREIKADGVSFFRYEHIKDILFPSFKYKVFPAESKGIHRVYPAAPFNLTVNSTESIKYFNLIWNEGKLESENDSASYYALYNIPNENVKISSEYLFDVVTAPKSSMMLAIEKPKKVNYFFALKSVNKLWNESLEPTNTVKVQMPQLKSLSDFNKELRKPTLVKVNANSGYIVLESGEKEQIEILGEKGKIFSSLAKELIYAGKNFVKISFEIKNYDRIKILFGKNKNHVELKLF